MGLTLLSLCPGVTLWSYNMEMNEGVSEGVFDVLRYFGPLTLFDLRRGWKADLADDACCLYAVGRSRRAAPWESLTRASGGAMF